MSSSAPAIRLTFADADPHNPDPAVVGALVERLEQETLARAFRGEL